MFFILGWLEKRLKVPDYEEKQKAYFRYPQNDPFHGFFDKSRRVKMTRGEAAEQRYSGLNYDHALPQGWVDACCEKGMDPRGHFVWLFDDYVGRPAPITEEGDRIASLLARNP